MDAVTRNAFSTDPPALARWLVTAAGVGLAAVAGAPIWAVAASLGLYVAAARWRGEVALVAWLPAVVTVPAVSVIDPAAWLALSGALLAALPWWPVPWAAAATPPVAGVALTAALVNTRLAVTLTASDVAVGAQAAVLVAGGLVGYAIASGGDGSSRRKVTGDATRHGP